jgi:signal transduction histidine kinase
MTSVQPRIRLSGKPDVSLVAVAPPGDAPVPAATPAAGTAPPAPPGPAAARRILTGVVVPAAVPVVLVLALRLRVPGGISDLQRAGFGLTFVAAISAALLAAARERTPQWQVAAGSLLAAVALAGYRLAEHQPGQSFHHAQAASTVATLLLIAVCVHLALALPDGRLIRPRRAPLGAPTRLRADQPSKARRIGVGLAYCGAIVAGALLGLSHHAVTVSAGALAWAAGLALTLPAVRLRYQASAGRERERLQWLGAGAVLAVELALVTSVLHVLVAWPGALAATAAACSVALPVGLIAGEIQPLGPVAGRVLVHLIAIAGVTIVVSAVYMIVVLGVGRGPATADDREVLGLSMLAAAIAAIGYLPARERLVASANRAVYGAREAPDEALRTFGNRLTRAISMDELLLQLAESLRKTMELTSAEVYTGSDDVLERTVSVPDAGPRSLVIAPRERPVVTRAGVSGSAWAAVWLPALLDGREKAQLRVMPVSHAGQLLGLIVIERPEAGDSFTEEDDRVLTELARQVGLALHNAQLDSALQNTLDELRAQAEALRESRARIVASGDAERRRLERNLHDGAQQNLVALAVTLRLARDVLADEPEAAAQMLDQLADDLRVTIQELRDLAHGIYPPLLADSGLGKALEAAASRSPQSVRVTATDLRRYSPDIEAAVYFCCLEALQNAAKHAPGATVDVRLWEQSGGLLFSVTDDGPGFNVTAARGGHGHVNMADRLGAIGGTIRWQSEPGCGATVQGSIPLA